MKSRGTAQATLPNTGDIPELPALIRQTIAADPSVGGAAVGTVIGEVASEISEYDGEVDLAEIGDAIERAIERGDIVRREDGLHLEES